MHPATAVLDSLTPAIDAAITRASGEDIGLVSPLMRMAAMAAYVADALRTSDASLITDSLLATLEANAQQALNNIEHYSDGRGAGHLSNATAELDGAMANIARVPRLSSGADVDHGRVALQAYHATVELFTRGIADQLHDLQTRASALDSAVQQFETRLSGLENRGEANLSAQQTNFDALQSQRQSTFDSAQANRQDSFEAEFSKQRGHMAQALQDWKEATDLALVASGRLLEERRGALDALIRDGVLEIGRTVATAIAEAREKSERTVAQLEIRRTEADKLVGIIGERGVTSTYQRTANEARSEMILWQGLTMLVMVCLLGAAVFEFLPKLANGWNWGIGGARIMVSVVAILTASYTGTQAKVARDTVRKNRRREMDLSALGPYLADLPESERNVLRMKIADRYFIDEVVAEPISSTLERLVDDPEITAALKGVSKDALLALLKAGRAMATK